MMAKGSDVTTTTHPLFLPYQPASKGSSPRLARLQPRGTAVAVVLTLASEQESGRFDVEVQLLQPANRSWHVLWPFKLPDQSVVRDLTWDESGDTLIVAHATTAVPTTNTCSSTCTTITRYFMHTCSVTTFNIDSASPSRFTQFLAYPPGLPSSPKLTTTKHQVGLDSFALATSRLLQPSLSPRAIHVPATAATTTPPYSIHISDTGEIAICDPSGADFTLLSSLGQQEGLLPEGTRILHSLQSPSRNLLHLLAATPLDAFNDLTHSSPWELSIHSIQLPRSFLVDDYNAIVNARSDVGEAFARLESSCSALSDMYKQFQDDFTVLLEPLLEACNGKSEELMENWTEGALFFSGRQIAAAELISAVSTGIPSELVKKSLLEPLAIKNGTEAGHASLNRWRQNQLHTFNRLLAQRLHHFQAQLESLSQALLMRSGATIFSAPILDTLIPLEDVDPELGILPSTPLCTFRDVLLALNTRVRLAGPTAATLSTQCATFATWLLNIADPKEPHLVSSGTVSGFKETVNTIKMCVEQEKYPAWNIVVGRDMSPPVRPMPLSESPLSGMRHLSDSARALLESMKAEKVVALLKLRWEEQVHAEMDKVVRRATAELSLTAEVTLLHFESSVEDLEFVLSAMAEVKSNLVVAATSRSLIKPIQLAVLQPDTESGWSSAQITRLNSTPSTSSPLPADTATRDLRFLARHDDNGALTSSTLFVTTPTTSGSDPGSSYCRVPLDSLPWMSPKSFDLPLWDERQWADAGGPGSQVHEALLADALPEVDGAKPGSAVLWLDGTDELSVVVSRRDLVLLKLY